MFGMQTSGAAWRMLVGSSALRTALSALGLDDCIRWRVEVSTPANSLHMVQECLLQMNIGQSPYDGSLCRATPVLLAVYNFIQTSTVPFLVVNLCADIATGILLRYLALEQGLSERGSVGVASLYLLNPLTILSCVAGTTSNVESTAVITTLYMAAKGHVFGAAGALAFASYLDLHHILLLVPVLLLLHSRSNTVQAPAADVQIQSAQCTTGKSKQAQQDAPRNVQATGVAPKHESKSSVKACDKAQGKQTHPRQQLLTIFKFLLGFLLSIAGLAASSEMYMSRFPGASCYPNQPRLTSSTSTPPPVDKDGPSGRCWAHAVYGLHLFIEDQTPNIGQLWYFFTEIFTPYLAFFRFVVHSLSVVLVAPMAIRFPHQPVFLFVSQCLINCMFKPYPSVADHALYLGLIPLLVQQLKISNSGMFLTVSFLLLAVLEPAMWHQWINIESANSNFYYSITLLLGAWQTLLFVLLLSWTVKSDRLIKDSKL